MKQDDLDKPLTLDISILERPLRKKKREEKVANLWSQSKDFLTDNQESKEKAKVFTYPLSRRHALKGT